MNYHMIRTDDMLNGDGLRVVLFVSGCEHECDGCHNPETHDLNGGREFTDDSMKEVLNELSNDYISGFTISGGDPLLYENLPCVYDIIDAVKKSYPNKTIWLYTGYKLKRNDFENIDTGWDNSLLRNQILRKCDIVCDGRFVKDLADVNLPWVGSSNQRVIDVQKTLASDQIVLYNVNS